MRWSSLERHRSEAIWFPTERAITSVVPLHLIISRRGMQRLTDGSRLTESAAYGIIISPGREVVEKRSGSARTAEMSALKDVPLHSYRNPLKHFNQTVLLENGPIEHDSKQTNRQIAPFRAPSTLYCCSLKVFRTQLLLFGEITI